MEYHLTRVGLGDGVGKGGGDAREEKCRSGEEDGGELHIVVDDVEIFVKIFSRLALSVLI